MCVFFTYITHIPSQLSGLNMYMSPREGSGESTANWSLKLPGSSNPPTSVSPVAGTTGTQHHALANLFIIF